MVALIRDRSQQLLFISLGEAINRFVLQERADKIVGYYLTSGTILGII